MVAYPDLTAVGALPYGQGWQQLGDIAVAFVLSTLIGLERELRQKSAGLRTHTLVGVASALIVLVSKYGFSDVLSPGRVVLDPLESPLRSSRDRLRRRGLHLFSPRRRTGTDHRGRPPAHRPRWECLR